jgi:hypothetical protein
MTEPLSPAARAVLNAASGWAGESNIAAAALRAAADRVYHHWDGAECVDYLCSIAAELEAN